MDEAEIKDKLTPEQYHILREKGTEAPFTGKLLHNAKSGDYRCAVCGNVVFTSDTKFDSGTGWPSFYDATNTKAVKLTPDTSLHEWFITRCAEQAAKPRVRAGTP